MEDVKAAAEHDAAFKVRIRYFQNATWQGEVVWLNQNKIQYFRSEIELIRLMEDAVEAEFSPDQVTLDQEER